MFYCMNLLMLLTTSNRRRNIFFDFLLNKNACKYIDAAAYGSLLAIPEQKGGKLISLEVLEHLGIVCLPWSSIASQAAQAASRGTEWSWSS